jgi:hypothetical protein
MPDGYSRSWPAQEKSQAVSPYTEPRWPSLSYTPTEGEMLFAAWLHPSNRADAGDREIPVLVLEADRPHQSIEPRE